ncbi:hypothetical protein [Terricaulis silvestris]|uniref:Uncharacterized protein n=1 Tax=Terricaulis silvestris TaxID=2686094 RepID=A0A6I6MK45_9CAUL|nr:hypothetical protein [Terricaulis silvestris]QGZ95049.1 hypothetical protein DSM104635_01889 [Terricaulis silvestris]
MGHHITGVIAKAEICRALSLKWGGRAICALEQGFGFLPLDYQNLRSVKDADVTGAFEKFVYLTPNLVIAFSEASRECEFAYIETEYHGGAGAQGAVLFRNGAVSWGPVQGDIGPINNVLKLVGVSKGEKHDEFEAVGLVDFRSNEAARTAALSPQDQRKILVELYAEIARLGALIDAPKDWLPGPKSGPASSHSWLQIEFQEENDGDDEDGYLLSVQSDSDGPWVCTAECSVQFSDSLLHVLFEGITHNMAMAARRPAKGDDPRRSLFRIQEELLAQLKPEWAARTAQSHAQILRTLPFKDG